MYLSCARVSVISSHTLRYDQREVKLSSSSSVEQQENPKENVNRVNGKIESARFDYRGIGNRCIIKIIEN